jgi:(heptosyl)LPS beta-1,4-glucosyltransferase
VLFFIRRNMSLNISAILITRNEAKHIHRCLASLAWLDDVIVVDGFSTDGTTNIAKTFPNVRLFSSDWKGFSETKRIAVRHATHDWILWIDADEAVTPDLQTEIQNRFTPHEPTDTVAFDVPRKTFFLGEWVQHTGWYPARVVRLFNKHQADFNDHLLHEGVALAASVPPVQHLAADLLHYSYTSLYQYFDKMNTYGLYGAEELVRRGEKPRVLQLILHPLATFVKFYFSNRGFLDGRLGLIISLGSAFSTFIKYTNFYYLSAKGYTAKDS